MWPNYPLPFGAALPLTSLPLDLPHAAAAVAVAIILVAGVFAFTIARLILERRDALVLTCPPARRQALVLVHRSVEGPIDTVVHCSRWYLPGDTHCDRSCLRQAA